jgi:hypothetical protein
VNTMHTQPGCACTPSGGQTNNLNEQGPEAPQLNMVAELCKVLYTVCLQSEMRSV